jgi:hypothetical protein
VLRRLDAELDVRLTCARETNTVARVVTCQ